MTATTDALRSCPDGAIAFMLSNYRRKPRGHVKVIRMLEQEQRRRMIEQSFAIDRSIGRRDANNRLIMGEIPEYKMADPNAPEPPEPKWRDLGDGWCAGHTQGYTWQAKVYDEGSQYGIQDHCGELGRRVSKLWIKSPDGKEVYGFDRGLDFDHAPDGIVDAVITDATQA